MINPSQADKPRTIYAAFQSYREKVFQTQAQSLTANRISLSRFVRMACKPDGGAPSVSALKHAENDGRDTRMDSRAAQFATTAQGRAARKGIGIAKSPRARFRQGSVLWRWANGAQPMQRFRLGSGHTAHGERSLKRRGPSCSQVHRPKPTMPRSKGIARRRCGDAGLSAKRLSPGARGCRPRRGRREARD